ERDRLARGYVTNLDEISKRLHAVEGYAAVIKQYYALGAALVVSLPAVIYEGAGAMASFLGGFAIFGVESAHQIYETFKQHEEVAFEYGASAALGLERYFDAESRKTEWWQTIGSIFVQGILQGVAYADTLRVLEEEAFAVYRGWATGTHVFGLR